MTAGLLTSSGYDTKAFLPSYQSPASKKQRVSYAVQSKNSAKPGLRVKQAAAAAIFVSSLCGSFSATPSRAQTDFSPLALTAKGGQDATIEGSQNDRNAELSARIISFKSLETDWDGDGGVPPSVESIDASLSFIDLLPLDSNPTGAMLEGTGEVGFYWKQDNAYIDITFDGKDIVYYARVDQEGRKPLEAMGRQEFSGHFIPADLLLAITSA